jgi:hypothetical protein
VGQASLLAERLVELESAMTLIEESAPFARIGAGGKAAVNSDDS